MEEIILDAKRLKEEVAYFLKQDAFVYDVETMDGAEPFTRGVPARNRVVWIGLATYGRSIVIPIGHPNGNVLLKRDYRKKNKETGKFDQFPPTFDAPPVQLKPSVVYEILRPLFFHPGIIKVAHSETFDAASMYDGFGAIPCGPYTDTIVMQWALDENIGEFTYGWRKRPMNKGLKVLSKWYFGVDYDKEEVGKRIEWHAFNKVARYLLYDVRKDWLLYRKFRKEVAREDVEAILGLENQVTEVCSQMRIVGAPVDVQAILDLEKDLSARLEILEANVYRAAGKLFNINSPQQKCDVLYGPKKEGGQGLKPFKLTDGGKKKKNKGELLTIYDYSTDAESLKSFEGNAVVDALAAYAEVSKLLSTYVYGYLGVEGNDKKPCRIFDGRIFTDLVQYGTLTGRFSSREPNLQNIPAPRTELGKKVRGLFAPPEGFKFLVADYAQMELRVLASMIGFGGLYDGFHAGIDAHTQTAALVYGVSVEEVEKWMRDAAKTLNFAIVYGAQADKVAKTLGISVDEAKQLLADHRMAFPEIYEWKDKIVALAQKRGRNGTPYIRTILGRKRRVWEIVPRIAEQEAVNLPWYEPERHSSAVRSVLARGERQVINSLVQGSLGDIIKLAMVRMHKLTREDALKNPGREIHMILSVHDELVIQCPDDRIEEGCAMLLEAMSGKEVQDLIKVPLAMTRESIAVVSNWADAKD